jgi:small multidrug resistance family-3 protein
MSRWATFGILAVCALLEAGGDALMRKGMHAGSLAARLGLYLLAATVLFAYGWLVNRPPWSFGSLLGVYVVLFFVVAQALGYFVFGDRITVPILVGGALIVSGGIVMTVWR